jgi:hypothetical protein
VLRFVVMPFFFLENGSFLTLVVDFAFASLAVRGASSPAAVEKPKDPQQLKLEEAQRRSQAFKEKIQQEVADLRRTKAEMIPTEPHVDRFTVRPPATTAPVDVYVKHHSRQLSFFLLMSTLHLIEPLLMHCTSNSRFELASKTRG